MTVTHIAFYGTLKSNYDTAVHGAIRKDLTLIGECTIPGKLYDLGRYPGLKTGAGEVKGELYAIKDQGCLKVLDVYELNDNDDPELPGFTRKAIKLVDPRVEAWVYCYDGVVKEGALIISGSWQ